MKRILVLLSILLVCSLVLVGCNGNSATKTTDATIKPVAATTTASANTSSPATSAAPDKTSAAPMATTVAASPSVIPQSGGILRMLTPSNPVSLYPVSMSGTGDGQLASICVESLFVFDNKGNQVPLLATGYQADASNKTITITLRKGVKFHDGTNFNAAAAKWNLDQYRTSAKSELKAVSSIDIIDDYTVRLNLSTFQNTIITYLAFDAGRMISPTAFNANGGKAWAEKNPVGTGPWKFSNWKADVAVSFVRFDDYWQGKPYLDGITCIINSNSTVAVMDFKAGNLDTMTNVAPNDTVGLSKMGQYNIVLANGQVSSLAGDTRDPKSPFNDILVRQAMAYAIDPQSICDGLGLGYYTYINQYAVPGTSYYNTNVAGYPYNPQKAKQLLTAAGYPNGFDTKLNFYNVSATQIDECTILQNNLNAVGIRTTLNPMDRNAYADMASNGKGFSGIIRTQNTAATSSDPLIIYKGIVSGQEMAGMLVPQDFVDAYYTAIAATDGTSKQKAVWNMASIANDKYCMAAMLFMQTRPVVKTKKLHDDLLGEYANNYVSPKAWLSK